MRRLASIALFPVCLAGSLALAWGMLALGAPPAVAMFSAYPIATVCFVAERVMPFAQRWRQSHGDVGTDILHVVFSQLAGSSVAALIVHAIPVHLEVWPTSWPLPVQVVLALVATELVQYTWHRSCHANRLLWKIHAVHHSPPRLTWLSSARFHPLEVVAEYVLVYAMLVVLGAPPVIVVLFTVATMTCSIVQHSNVKLRLGALNWVFVGTELHHRHHAADPRSQLTNYGTILILWDLGAGHASAAARAARPAGHRAPRLPQTYVGQLLAPLRWKP